MTAISLGEKNAVQSILSCFESGRPLGGYGTVAVLADGAGISYGKHQATDRSGALDAIVQRYEDLKGAYASEFGVWGAYLVANKSTQIPAADIPDKLPSDCLALMTLLRKAGDDPVMQRAQDQVFDERYWNPCAAQCSALELRWPLSWAVCYDSYVQSWVSLNNPLSFPRIRRTFTEKPPVNGGNEEAWARAYAQARNRALAAYVNTADPKKQATIRATVYRTAALLDVMDSGNWMLSTPFSLHVNKSVITIPTVP